jgi:hypothetical protein
MDTNTYKKDNFAGLRESLINDYKAEIWAAKNWKANGTTNVNAMVAGDDLAAGREAVGIDEYIQNLEKILDELCTLPEGEDPSKYSY